MPYRKIGRANIVFAHDIAMCVLSFLLALWLRLGGAVFALPTEWILFHTCLFALCAALIFELLGLYKGLWRYASLNDLFGLARAVVLTVLLYLAVAFALTRLERLPRSFLFIEVMLLMFMMGMPRIAYRLFKDGQFGFRRDRADMVPTLLVGGGQTADAFVRAMRMPEAPYRVIGFLAQDRAWHGARLQGVEVVGHVDDDLLSLVKKLEARGLRPQHLIIADDDIDGPCVSRLLDATQSLGIPISRLPKLTELKNGVNDRLHVRAIAIEDLLHRPQACLDLEGMHALIRDRIVLVTGAGGSIGSELVRQISDFEPRKILLVDHSEFNLYLIDQDLAERHPSLSRVPILADVRDTERIHSLFTEFKPDLVFHAAALKHVPMVEMNPAEGVLTNVLGTRNVADACRAVGAQVMVMISTDKAVNPSSVMGATKRLAESYCQALDLVDSDRPNGTRFVSVRFGNVLGSTGSVVPLFQRQLAKGGPLTVTHPDIQRYFMTIREAVELVLQASVLRCNESVDNGVAGRLFELDMGEPVKIHDLARRMIRLAGLRPDIDVKIVFTGMRPGEKLSEELFHAAEDLVPTTVPGIHLAAPRTTEFTQLSSALAPLLEAARRRSIEETLRQLLHLVPEYAANAAKPTPDGT